MWMWNRFSDIKTIAIVAHIAFLDRFSSTSKIYGIHFTSLENGTEGY
jgi:ethanolamine utilization microcompartment shell protein EutS